MKTGKILDPIHGLIEITEIEEFIINQKIFGRLRKVKQNTLLNYIFPGANHTRFEHSIGVMHLAELMYNKSNENVETTYLKKQKYGVNKEYFSVIDYIKEKDEQEIILQELRLAALLHDIGHGPTSHKFDDFTVTGQKLLDILKTKKDVFNDFLGYFENFINSKKIQNKKIEHELVSCVFVIKLIHDLKSNENLTNESLKIKKSIKVENILKMIDPEFLPDYEIEIAGKNFTNYFNSIIAGFPFDADRMDYLYRDSFYSGVKYGFFDQSRILASLLPVEHAGKFTLGIKKSGLDSIVRFIQSRNHLYTQVYFHKTNSATNAMLDFVFRHLNGQSVLDNIENYKGFEDFYCRNGDEYFFNTTLKDILEKNGCRVCEDGCIENDVLDELLDRNLWKRCFEERKNIKDIQKKEDFNQHKFDQEKLDELKSRLEKDDGILIHENYSSNMGLKGYEKSRAVLIDNDLKKTRNDWSGISDEMEFLSMTNVFIKRVYVRRNETFTTADEFKKIEERIKLLVKDL
ncbi:HD superfamily phosphohydrolase [Chryseobacterium vietnamense]|uniref:HD domain-containing protein n=1 Tax=Chryseobacterium vietnamense TaxID=866785 RepID=UPI00286110CD|nr:HD domain-containing protein [Chryseobacterium vietnamense]MDR6487883.1 HD superfamily phosphohydrolase [Chryseobacterium vietnamense]